MNPSKAHRPRLTAALAGVALGAIAVAAHGQTIIDSWNSVAIPPPPELKPATVDAASAALLVLDMNADQCTQARRPSCVRSVPRIQRLIEDARAHHMPVVFSASAAAPTAPLPAPLTRAPGDPLVVSSADKFIGVDLEAQLKGRGIKTVIVVGTTAEGAVLYTASSAALRGFAVVAPVDGFSSDKPFAELLTAWQLRNAPVSVSNHVTLTRSDMITLR